MSNPLLEPLKLPGRVLQLPSKGLFYTNGEMSEDVVGAEVHVRAMSAVDEIYLKNPDQLFNGHAIKKVTENSIPEILKPMQLLSKDVDALVLFLRLVTYGPMFDVTANHGCEKGKEHSYSVDLEAMVQRMKFIDETTIKDSLIAKTSTGQVVQLRPALYTDVMSIVQRNQTRTELSLDQQKQNMIDMLMTVTQNVDGIEDRAMIEEWYCSLSRPEIMRVLSRFDTIEDWGVDNTVTCICKDCGAEFVLDVPIDPVSFFTE